MELFPRGTWANIHGLVLGGIILLAFIGALAGMWRIRAELRGTESRQARIKVLRIALGALALVLWAAVITGTWIVYPWYREKLAGAGLANCEGLAAPSATCSPRDFLLSNASGETAMWHELGMEWKEHIAWTAPFLATSAFLLVSYYGSRVMTGRWLRTALFVMVVAAIGAATIGGGFGTFISKIAPLS